MQPARPLELAVLADELGFDLIGIQYRPYRRRFYDTWTLLTAIAMRTKHVTVFPDVVNTYIVSGEDPEAMRQFAAEVAPAVREAVAKAR